MIILFKIFTKTIFEIGTKTTSEDYKVMKVKRMFHKESILNFRKKIEERKAAKADASGKYVNKMRNSMVLTVFFNVRRVAAKN